MTTLHIPVMVEQTLHYLVSKPTGTFVDCTLGTGGHMQALSKTTDANSYLIGIDADPSAVQYCKDNLSIAQPHQFLNANFVDLKRVCYRAGFQKVDGILMDLGISSFALDDPSRGLTFSQNGPLDMRFSPSIPQTAADFINNASLTDMLKVFREYGEERNSLRIARRIIDERAKQEFRTTGQLADVIKQVVPGEFQVKTLSRIFQAIRMHINSEVAVLQRALADAVSLLAADGRIVVISYHSIEDRIVKQHFKTESKDCICPPEFPVCQCHHKARLKILTDHPVLPNHTEINNNPRARSAKLRAAARLTE